MAPRRNAQLDLSIKEELHHLIEEELYKLPGFKPQKMEAFQINTVDGRPESTGEFSVTSLRADNSLPIRESVFEKHMKAIKEVGDKALLKEFEGYVQEHNELYNTSGQNWSEQLKRPIEE